MINVDKIKKLPKTFFTKYRDDSKKSKKEDYSKIEEIKWSKDVLSGKRKVVGSLPNNKKMI